MEKSQIQPSEKKKDLIPLSNREYPEVNLDS